MRRDQRRHLTLRGLLRISGRQPTCGCDKVPTTSRRIHVNNNNHSLTGNGRINSSTTWWANPWRRLLATWCSFGWYVCGGCQNILSQESLTVPFRKLVRQVLACVSCYFTRLLGIMRQPNGGCAYQAIYRPTKCMVRCQIRDMGMVAVGTKRSP